MNEAQALTVFDALSQDTRLRVVRLLVRAGPAGIPAGQIAGAVGVSASNISFHLKELERAGVISARRDARSIIYAADLTALSDLVRFLMEDCCGGHPEICLPALSSLEPRCLPKESQSMTSKTFNVLFLCTGNTARSILAEGILRKDGAGRFNVYSAGSQPKGTVNPFALRVLDAYNYPSDGFRSKNWDEFAAPGAPVMDFVITVCDSAAGETCPLWPGQPMTAHWGIPDPAAIDGTEIEKEAAFNMAFKLLKNRISLFTALPIASLDQLTLSNRLREIGRSEGASPGAAR